MQYFWQSPDWPDFYQDDAQLASLLGRIEQEQGRLSGRIEALGYKVHDDVLLNALTQDVVKTSEIEGEKLDEEQVRSSIARRLGIDIDGFIVADRHVEGAVQMTLDATRNCDQPLTADRLFSWHAALFPTGRNEWGQPLRIGAWRDDAKGAMQIVSGGFGHEKVHYEAPPASWLEQEMTAFLSWFNAPDTTISPLLKASTAHIWFVSIHPFDDGNGRITRAIADMALARAGPGNERLYSMTAQIRKEQKNYFARLNQTSTGASMDLTAWHIWFLACLERAVKASLATLDNVLQKAGFWQHHTITEINERQAKVINRLLEGFEGKLTSSKYATLTKVSQDTANRDIADLVAKSILQKSAAGGRSTSYDLVLPQPKKSV